MKNSKHVNVNARINFLFFLLTLLIGMVCIAKTAFGQEPQSYGDSTLIEAEVTYDKDQYTVNLIPDMETIEVIFIDDAQMPESITEFSVGDVISFDISNRATFYVKTKSGITVLKFVMSKEKKFYAVLNGKLLGVYKNGKPRKNLDGMLPDSFSESAWEYDPKLAPFTK